MLTPQEVQDKKFAKAVFGGYDMGEVDEFLDQIVSDYEQLYKENAILKGKLKTLAEKVEEYRSVDDDMRKTLADAKKQSDKRIADAQKQAEETTSAADEYAKTVRADADSYSEKLLSEARAGSEELLERARRSADEMLTTSRAEAMQKLSGIRGEIEAENGRLAAARQETKKYAAEVADVCKRQLEALRSIVSTPAPAPVAEEDEPATAAFSERPIAGGDRPVESRITERHAEEPAAASAAETVDEPSDGAVESAPVSEDEQPTIRFEPVRRVDIGGDTLEFGEPDDEQSDDDAFRQIFGGEDRKD